MKRFFDKAILLLLASVFVFSFVFVPVDSYAMDSYIAGDPDGLDFIENVADHMLSRAEKINVASYNLDEETLISYMDALFLYEPLTMLLRRTYSYTYGKTKVSGVNLQYEFEPDEVDGVLQYYRNAIKDCIRGIHGDWSDEEKLLYLVNYVANHFVYDYSLMIFDVYNFLREGKGVCNAYTLFASAVLTELGFENDTIVSTALNHIWNRVKVGDAWYNIDFTWASTGVPGNVKYDYFLRSDTNGGSDTDFKTIHVADTYDWKAALYSDDNATTDYYVNTGNCWYETNSSFIFVNGYWYYLSPRYNGKVAFRRTADFHVYETITSITDYYYVKDELGGQLSGYWGGIKAIGTKVIFTTAKHVVIYDTVAARFETLYTYMGDIDNCIYGFVDNGDSIDLLIRSYCPTLSSTDDMYKVETVNFKIPHEYLVPEELQQFAEKLEYYYDKNNDRRLLFGINEGDFPGTLVAAIGGDARTKNDGVFSKSAVLTTGSIFRMGELEYRISIPGDTDCDGSVDKDDALYALSAILNPDYFPIVYEQDFDQNGEFDSDDAVYLYMRSIDPAGYPIATK